MLLTTQLYRLFRLFMSAYLIHLMLIFSTEAVAETHCMEQIAQLYYLHYSDPKTLETIAADARGALQNEVIPSEWTNVKAFVDQISGASPAERELISWTYATNQNQIQNQITHLKGLLKDGQQDGTKDPRQNKGLAFAWGVAVSPAASSLISDDLSVSNFTAVIPQMIRLLIGSMNIEPKFKPHLESLLNTVTATALIYKAYDTQQIFFLLAGFWFLAGTPTYLEGVFKKSKLLIKRANSIYMLASLCWIVALWKLNPSAFLALKITSSMLPIAIATQYLARLDLSKKSMWMKEDLSELYSNGRFSDSSAAYQEHPIEVDSGLRRLLFFHFHKSRPELAKKINSHKGKIILHLHQLFFEKIVADIAEPRLASIFELEFLPQPRPDVSAIK